MRSRAEARLVRGAALCVLFASVSGVARTPTFVPRDPLITDEPPCATQPAAFTVETPSKPEDLLDALIAQYPVPSGIQNLELTVSAGGARVGLFHDFNLKDPMDSALPTYSVALPDGVVMTSGYLVNQAVTLLGLCE